MVQLYKRMLLILSILAFSKISNAQDFKVVGYLTNWGNFAVDATNVDYSKVTHINVAFINPTKDEETGIVTLGPTNGLASAVNTIHSNNRKVLISLGGATAYTNFPEWPNLITSSNRGAFIHLLMTFVNTYNIDGIDMDLEGDDVDANYNAFVVQLNDSLRAKNKLFTAALGTWFAGKIQKATLDKFDWINAMAYDEYGTWTGRGEHSTFELAEEHLYYWITTRSIPKNKVILGVPFYGYRWEKSNTSLGYCSITTNWPRGTTKDTLFTATGGFVSYNGIPTIKAKTVLALEECSGIMIWTLQYDCPTSNPNSLLLAINQAINEHTNNIAPTVTLTGPADGATYEEGDVIRISADAADQDGTISLVAFYQGTTKIGEDDTAPYYIDWVAEAGSYTIVAKAMDNVPALTISEAISITVNPTAEQKPFNGAPWTIPGKIEAEGFDFGKNLGYYDIDDANKGGAYRSTSVDIEMCSDQGGGYNVGYIAAGEWLKYTTSILKDSLYDIEIRYASNNINGGQLSIELDGENITGTANLTITGGWQTWKTLKISKVRLYEGTRIMKINLIGGEYNINYVNFSYNNPLASIFGGSKNNSNLSIYPNPIENQSTLKLNLTEQGMADVTILDLAGKELLTLPQQYLSPGDNFITIDGARLKTGLYLCKVVLNGRVSTITFTKN